MLKTTKNIIFIFLSVFWVTIFSQELPPIQNFSPATYKAENQNWGISQSSDKHIYVANNKGLLAFNGATWKLYPSPNKTIIRSVKAIRNKIYTGCYMEFGYWKKNKLGVLNYTSLTNKLKINLVEDEEFWNIQYLENSILFQSFNSIYVYNTVDNSTSVIRAKNKITKIFKVNNQIYFQKMNEGLFKIVAGKEQLIIDSKIIKKQEIVNIYTSNSGLLLLSKSQGFFKYENNLLTKWNINADKELTDVILYSSVQLKNKHFALGTISNGLIVLDENGKFLYKLNQDNELQNNTVLALYEDVDANIWLGLDNGISYLNVASKFKVYNDSSGNLGSVYAAIIYANNLYLGTNQGLFYKTLNDEGSLKLVRGTEGQVWSLNVIDNNLFCNHNSGTFIIKANNAIKIPNTQGSWGIKILKDSSKLLLGAYDGLYILEKENNNWVLKNKIDGFNNSARYFEPLNDYIFVNHEYRGVFKLKVNNDFTKVLTSKIDTLIKGYDSGIIKYNNDLLYAYSKGVYKYTNNTFLKDSVLSTAFTEANYSSGKFSVDNQNNLWLFNNKGISYTSPSKLSEKVLIKNIPLTKEVRKSITGYENILQLHKENTYLIGTKSGYITFNKENLQIKDFNVFISSVVGKNSKVEKVFLVDKNVERDFKNKQNNFEIAFYVPEFDKFLTPQYQYKLTGMYDNWSTWSSKANATFENLPFGNYSFKVRAKIGDKLSKNVASYNFSIAKPWYISNVMILIYILTVLLFLMFMHQLYKRYYKKQKQRLMQENEKNLALTKAQSEKEIINLKNEQLEKENKNKSKELAASTMNLVKKNELLTQIKEQLTQLKNKSVMPVIETINDNLNNTDNWEFFKEAFNNADSEFLKKLKDKHPNLSPNDLKLCAYLRLNLSSKEIAPLFNISPRSVEIKRYRLRKKINLPHEKNLTDYILEL